MEGFNLEDDEFFKKFFTGTPNRLTNEVKFVNLGGAMRWVNRALCHPQKPLKTPHLVAISVKWLPDEDSNLEPSG